MLVSIDKMFSVQFNKFYVVRYVLAIYFMQVYVCRGLECFIYTCIFLYMFTVQYMPDLLWVLRSCTYMFLNALTSEYIALRRAIKDVDTVYI